MPEPRRRPAAYMRSPARLARSVMASAAHQRGWPEPEIYASGGGAGNDPGLAELTCALAAGRHDALLMAVPDLHDPAITQLLELCNARGVTVSFVPAPPEDTRSASTQAAGQFPAGLTREPWSILTRARLDALTGLFPHWRIWLDNGGWHARRRGGHLQAYRTGAPAFHVTADTATELAAQLCWQQAADAHTPDGCASGRLAEEHGLSLPAGTGHGH